MSAEWLVEQGIGETRAILCADAEIRAARIDWGEALRPGLVAEARLVSRPAGGRRGTVRLDSGDDALIDQLPREATEGVRLVVRVVRASIAEKGRTKLPVVRVAPGEVPTPAPDLAAQLGAAGDRVRILPATDRTFVECGWDELVEQAQSGEIPFAGGSLLVSPTPAMTLIDVDGFGQPAQLALAAVPAIAGALMRLDIGGNVGIDFPTVQDRKDRQAIDAALEAALAEAGWRGERTGMNGFGFVQLVSRLERPSLVARYARNPAAASARILLRQAERVAEPGALLLCANPRTLDAMRPDWLEELARRTGRVVRLAPDPALALSGGFAQAVPL